MKATLCKGGSRPPVLISMALPLNQVNFNPDALKTSRFRPPHKTKSPIPTMKSSLFRPPTLHPNQFHPYTEIKSSLISHTDIK